MVLESQYPSLDIPKISFADYHLKGMQQFGHRICLIDAETDRRLTCQQIREYAFKFASFLTRKGINKQEIVALAVSNCIEYPSIILGTSACNAITTLCNPNYTFDETLKQFEQSLPKLVITDSAQMQKMAKVAERLPSIQEIIPIDKIEYPLLKLLDDEDGSNFPYDVEVDIVEDIVVLPYSSGTTGVPKGVILTHQNLVALHCILRSLGVQVPWVTNYATLPMFHSYELTRLLGNLWGGRMVVAKRFGVESMLQAIEKYKISVIGIVPAMGRMLVQSGLMDKYDISSVKAIRSGAAPLTSSTSRALFEKTQVPPLQGWGLTECVGIAIHTRPGAPAGSVGFLLPNTRLKVVDPVTREELGANQDGEMMVKGPHVTKGYYRNTEANRIAFDAEGWFCTGDIGHYDENGIVYVVDRMKELIKYKGFQVAPAELENVIASHHKVGDVAVVGINDLESGEVPKAYVVRKDPSLTEREIVDFVKDRVSKYKHLRGGVQFIGEIPKNETGKILRRKLKERDVIKSKM